MHEVLGLVRRLEAVCAAIAGGDESGWGVQRLTAVPPSSANGPETCSTRTCAVDHGAGGPPLVAIQGMV